MVDVVYTQGELRDMILPLLEKHGMASARLFGSYARGEADGASDIDVLLCRQEGTSLFNVCGLAEDLHRVSGKRVDVYEESELCASPFRDAVLREAIAL